LSFDGGDGRSGRSFFLSGDKVGGSGEGDESDESEEQFLSHGKNSKVLKGEGKFRRFQPSTRRDFSSVRSDKAFRFRNRRATLKIATKTQNQLKSVKDATF